MSVPVPKRGHGELEVNSKARALTVYTLKILENEKWFPKEQAAFIAKLQDCAIEIQALCWEANNIKVGESPEEVPETGAQGPARRVQPGERGRILADLDGPHLQGKQLAASAAAGKILSGAMGRRRRPWKSKD